MLTRASKTNKKDHKTVTRSCWFWLNWIGNVSFEGGNTEAVVQNKTSECLNGRPIAIAAKLESHITVYTRAEIQRRRILTGLSSIHSQIFLLCFFHYFFFWIPEASITNAAWCLQCRQFGHFLLIVAVHHIASHFQSDPEESQLEIAIGNSFSSKFSRNCIQIHSVWGMRMLRNPFRQVRAIHRISIKLQLLHSYWFIKSVNIV